MRLTKSARFVVALSIALGTAGWTACNKARVGDVSAAASDAARVPITTTSDQARNEFLLGRDLSERLLGQESLQHFDKAITLDPPLRFRSRPGALRVRIAPQHPGASPSTLEPDTMLGTIGALAGFVVGRRPAGLVVDRGTAEQALKR